jgi:CubicO group peptidase (beta-lactamase class C family)
MLAAGVRTQISWSLFVLSIVLLGNAAFAQDKSVSGTPSRRAARSSPESQGISSGKIREFVEAANSNVNTMHSFMLVRHGHVVAEGWWSPESAEQPHILWSLSKSFTSTAVGLAVAEGKLTSTIPC